MTHRQRDTGGENPHHRRELGVRAVKTGRLVLSESSRAIWKELKVATERLTVGCDSEHSLGVVAHWMFSQPCLASKDLTASAQKEMLQPLA